VHTLATQLEPPAQTVPHVPQFVLLVVVSTHVPAHDVSPAGHRHKPAWQVVPPAQTVLHAPQLFGSVSRSTQTLLHAV